MESATGIRSAVGWRKVEDVVELMEAELILGNGSVQAGRGLMAAWARRERSTRGLSTRMANIKPSASWVRNTTSW